MARRKNLEGKHLEKNIHQDAVIKQDTSEEG
jgi:hypothetical protein